MKKQFSKTKSTCKVTFELAMSAVADAKKAVLIGDFNDWDHSGIPLKKSTKDASFKVALELETGKDYEFRYLINDSIWENDANADWYCASCFPGFENSVVSIPKQAEDLKKIEGIGPKIASILIENGIDTFEKLGVAKISVLKNILKEAGPKFQMHDPGSWSKQAKLAAKGQWDKLAKLQDELDGGR